jgi:hypothetical protein
MTTAYHPQANGRVERLHRQVKGALRARQCGTAWMEHLSWVLLGLRAAPKDDSGVSAAEVIFGTTLVLPNQVLVKAAAVEQAPTPVSILLRARSYAEAVKGPVQALEKADYVYVLRGAASQPLTVSYKVVARQDKIFKLQVGGRVETVLADRLNPYSGAAAPGEAAPPRRGRPPGTGGSGQPPASGAAAGGAYVAEVICKASPENPRNIYVCS